jgi:mxaJ protein
MYSRCRDSGLGTWAGARLRASGLGKRVARISTLTLLAVAPLTAGPTTEARVPGPESRILRVCADPNNLPFSNRRREGFENKIVELVARELHATVRYTWWAQRRGFVRNTLGAGECDVLPGVPVGFDRALLTRPYYSSSYVFVYRKDRGIAVRSLDDTVLRRVKVGVQLVGDDYANTPPAHALARRGIVGNVTGYTVYGDYARPNPPARIIDAVVTGEVDVAIVWGPLAGYFAARQRVPLAVVPVSPLVDPPRLPLAFDIAMGVRRGDRELRAELDAALERRRSEIRHILDAYGIPRTGEAAPKAAT